MPIFHVEEFFGEVTSEFYKEECFAREKFFPHLGYWKVKFEGQSKGFIIIDVACFCLGPIPDIFAIIFIITVSYFKDFFRDFASFWRPDLNEYERKET